MICCSFTRTAFPKIIPFLFFCCSVLKLLAQQKITGTVLNTDNLPLAGATISLKSSNLTTITLADGSFTITAKPGDVLEISYAVFKTQQIKIGNEKSLKIILHATVVTLDDIVVTGYTTQKVKEITGSVAVIKPKDLIAVPAGQVEQMLQGRVAGPMQQTVEKLKQERVLSNKPYFELHIGIHTGPVVAGVVGIKKIQYDIWGDTVNLAARMEQSGVPGKINISQHTYELVKEQFTCVHRGKIEAKNKGDVDMYFVE